MKTFLAVLGACAGCVSMTSAQTLPVPRFSETQAEPHPIPRFSDVPSNPNASGVLKLPPLTKAPLIQTKTFMIEPVTDSPGVYRLTARQANVRQILHELATVSGRRVIFLPGFPNQINFSLLSSLEGTPSELISKIAKLADLNKAEGLQEPDTKLWFFWQQSAKQIATRKLPILKSTPTQKESPWSDMNINPNPGKNLSEDAQPFDFNGKRWYHVPLT